MFARVDNRDWLTIGSGLVCFFSCVIFGAIAVEIQVNQLTHWQDFVQVFNIKRNISGTYFAYLFGSEYDLQAVWQVGAIANTERSIVFTILNYTVTLPTQLDFDATQFIVWITPLIKRGTEEAYQIKRYLEQAWQAMLPFWQGLLRHIISVLSEA